MSEWTSEDYARVLALALAQLKENALPVPAAIVERPSPPIRPDRALREAATRSPWRALAPELRNDVIRQMSVEELKEVLREDDTDPLQNALRAAMDGDFSRMKAADWSSLLLIQDGLRHVLPLPAREEIERNLELERLLEPMRVLTRAFYDRTHEMEALREFVRAERAARAPFFIYGMGGVGKTTLMSRLILEHAGAMLFVYLDFDRPMIDAENPVTLLLEGIRQIALQHEQAYGSSERLRERWENDLRSASQRTDDRFVFDFAAFLERLNLYKNPILFVLDTFEEVQRRSAVQARRVVDLMQMLIDRVPRLRLVVAGRAPIENVMFEGELDLGDFDRQSAVAYLAGQGIEIQTADAIVRQVGCSPHRLNLVLELHDRGETFDNERVRTLRLRGDVLQASLFDRILLHIDARVRSLAYPGLVARRVTPEVIRDVLAVPCGVDVPNLARAQELFDILARELTVVNVSAQGVLVPRPDVRALMLQSLRDRNRKSVEDIHLRAIDYYSAHDDVVSRAEELYHRLSAGMHRDVIASRWIDGVDAHLRDAVDELPLPSQAILAQLLGVELSPEALQAADQETWERNAQKTAIELMVAGQPLAARAVLRKRSERTAITNIYVVETMVMRDAGDFDEALETARSGIRAYSAAGNVRALHAVLLVRAQLERQIFRRYDDAECLLDDAHEIAQRQNDPLMLLRGFRERIALARDTGTDLDPQKRQAMAEAADASSDLDWAAEPQLLREIAAEIAETEPAILARALELNVIELRSSELEVVRRTLHLDADASAETIRSTMRSQLNATAPPPALVHEVLNVLGRERESRPQRMRSITLRSERLRDVPDISYPSLANFLEARLARSVESISSSKDPKRVIADVIDMANNQAWLLDLVIALARSRFDDAKIQELVDEVGLGPRIKPPLDLSAFRRAQGEIGAVFTRTCTIESGGRVHGCGFLIADDRVLTSSDVWTNLARPEDAVFRFDEVFLRGESVNRGEERRLAKADWRVRHAPRGYDVVRLDRAIATLPVDPPTADPDARPRGFIALSRRSSFEEPMLWLWRDGSGTNVSGSPAPGSIGIDSRGQAVALRTDSAVISTSFIAADLDPYDARFSETLPLINRAELRGNLQSLLEGAARILLVQGERGSGKTFTRRFIHQLSRDLGFKVVEIDFQSAPDFSVLEVGRIIADVLGLRLPEARLSSRSGELASWLAQRSDYAREPWWFVFDHFDQMSSEIYDFIELLALRATSLRLVLIDYDQAFPPKFQRMVRIENTGQITKDDISDFFTKVQRDRAMPLDVPALTHRVVEAMNANPQSPLEAMSQAIRDLLEDE